MKQIGRYEILRELGRGAMGVVYAATDPLIGREVAIKTIRLDLLEDDAARADLTRRLFREAQSAGVLSHPGIITIYDVGEVGREAYIVMEFVAGRTLEEVLASGIPQHSGTLFSILHQAAVALDYAHTKKIVHRDIKPSNIMISPDGTVKIADFGVAKLADSTSMTQAGFVLGTPSYMSPEQAQGRAIDGNSDQFSLAVVAFRMMTGKLPFEGPTLTALLAKLLWEEPAYENSGLSPSIKPAFEKAFSKNPESRFALCEDLVRALESGYAQHKEEAQKRIAQPAASKPVAMEKEPAPSPIPEAPPEMPARVEKIAPASQSPAPAEHKRKGKLLWAACAAALLLFVVAGIVIYAFRTSPEKEAAKQVSPQKAVAIPPQESAKEPAPPVNSQTEPVSVPPVQPAVKPVTEKPAPVAAKPVPPSAKKPNEYPIGGSFTWSGSLGKNALLVIDGQTASIGTVAGNFLPGKPVSIEVEPAGIAIRQQPGQANGWRQIMLYSGPAKYDSITIRWKRITAGP
jgi:serine/threonine protein kinase